MNLFCLAASAVLYHWGGTQSMATALHSMQGLGQTEAGWDLLLNTISYRDSAVIQALLYSCCRALSQ